MKNLIILTVIFSIFFSCKKPDTSEYMGTLPEIDSSNIENQYPLDGTIWVLLKVTGGYTRETCNDTIIFHKKFYDRVINGKIISNDGYCYSMYKTMDIGNPYNITIHGFSPFGNSNGWSASLNNTFIDEWEIPISTFTNLSTDDKIKASFKRIK